ncbi:MAG: response regulator [Mangrovicoccus sp.]
MQNHRFKMPVPPPGEACALRCLVIEDEEMDQISLTRHLRKITTAHFDLDFVNSLVTARQHLIAGCYDIVFVDHHLPDGFGAKFLAEMQSSGLARWAKAVLLTGLAEHAKTFADTSRVAVLEKGEFTTDDLADELMDVIGKKAVTSI